MDHLLNWLWQGGAVAVATSITLRLLVRSRANARYVLCWIAMLVLLSLPVMPTIGGGSPPAVPALDPPAPVAPLVAVPTAWWTSIGVLILLWISWVAVCGTRLLTAVWGLRRLMADARPFPGVLEARLVNWNRMKTAGRQARLVLVPGVRSAAVVGFGSPVIAIAPSLLERLSGDELDAVVVHEWAHVQRRDDLMHVAHLTVRAIAGWHPAVWWLERQLRIEREAACDEIAVAITGSSKAYASSLATVASLAPSRIQMVAAVGALSAPGLRHRVVRILSHRRLRSSSWSTMTAMMAVLTLGSFSSALAGFRLVEKASPLNSVRTAAPERPQVPFSLQESIATSSPGRPPDTALRPARQSVSAPAADRPATTRTGGAVEPSRPIDSTTPTAERTPASIADLAPPPLATLPPRTPGLTMIVAPPSAAARLKPDDRPPALWEVAADGGVAVGKASQKAAVATAGFFSRFGKSVAASF